MRKALKLLAVLLALIASPALAEWHRAESRNFIIYGEMPADALRAEALRLESFDRLLRLRLGVTTQERQVPLTIYLLAKHASVTRITGTEWIGGFYRTDPFGSIAVTSMEKPKSRVEGPVEDILLHEYSHHFQLRHVPTARPTWYVEGFAQYYATAQLSPRGEWSVGLPANNRGIQLNSRFEVPIRRLLTEDFAAFTGQERGAYYARAWLFTHYLNAAPDRQASLAAFLAAVGRGEDRQAAATAHFGDLSALERKLDDYKHAKLISVTYNSFGSYDGPLSITAVDGLTERRLWARLLRLNRKALTEARAAAEALTREAPGSADGWFELALTLREEARATRDRPQQQALFAQSEAAVDKALAADPKHVSANVLKADYRTFALRAAKEADPAKWRDARSFLLTANAANPDDPATLAGWHETMVRQGRVPSQTAHDGLARAFALQPEEPRLRTAYALDLARLGRFDEAIRLAETVATDPHRSRQGLRLLRRLEALKRGETPMDEPEEGVTDES